MIDRQGGKIVWECDSCDSTFEWDDEDEFAKGWEAARAMAGARAKSATSGSTPALITLEY